MIERKCHRKTSKIVVHVMLRWLRQRIDQGALLGVSHQTSAGAYMHSVSTHTPCMQLTDEQVFGASILGMNLPGTCRLLTVRVKLHDVHVRVQVGYPISCNPCTRVIRQYWSLRRSSIGLNNGIGTARAGADLESGATATGPNFLTVGAYRTTTAIADLCRSRRYQIL